MVAQKPASTPWFFKNQPPQPGCSKTSYHAQVTTDRKITNIPFTFFFEPPGGKSHAPDSNVDVPRSNFDLFLIFFGDFFVAPKHFFKYRATRRPRSSRLACSKALEKTKTPTRTTGAETAQLALILFINWGWPCTALRAQ